LGSRLRAHQIEGVKFLWRAVARRSGAILADAMGLGKTLQSLTLLWTALKQSKHGSPLAKRAIIVTPTYHYFHNSKTILFFYFKINSISKLNRSLTNNWHKEIKKWLGFERLKVKTKKFSIYKIIVDFFKIFFQANCYL